jgi:hypothetical protein
MIVSEVDLHGGPGTRIASLNSTHENLIAMGDSV